MKLVAIPPGDGRVALLPVLFLADSAEDHVRAHLDDGELFGLVEDGGSFIGAIQLLDALRRSGCTRAIVGTSNAGVGEIADYQKCGFRLLSIERDHFNPARGYDGTEMDNGIVHRDLVWFDQSLV